MPRLAEPQRATYDDSLPSIDEVVEHSTPAWASADRASSGVIAGPRRPRAGGASAHRRGHGFCHGAEPARVEWWREDEDEVLSAGLLELCRRLGCGTGAAGVAQLDGHLDLLGVAADRGAMAVEGLDLVAQDLGRATGQGPLIGPARRDA